ncbi:hypothetical protein QMK19_39150 [Streptomyces sp. H10-C2]|uniref:hypothetical protein n=1 Tax=unclassified Streptomyces TaxID=2593676 RepID=UPI0024BB4F64|nr:MULTISPECIES: hypothetical protein [unclassified Streptomyces]MDJ0347535.1 hypothetical protein [Streptomyces sp. PH10-H1]MDJ0375454.1 hypothetical protein [Streptomyces sp. H10-C2]
MATYTKPACTPQSFDELINRLKGDEIERRRAIEIIQAGGAMAFGEEYFALTDKQRDQLAAATSDPAADFRWRALLSQGLVEGKPVRIVPTTTRIGVSIDVTVDSDGSVSVSVSCEL